MFDLDDCVAFITSKSAKIMMEAFNKRLVPLGVTRVQWIALYYLGKCDGMHQKELGEKIDIKEATVARLIDRMERDNLVMRQKDLKDRRITNVMLTDKGKRLRRELLPEGVEMSQIFAEGLSDEEIRIFNKVMDKMVENAQRNK